MKAQGGGGSGRLPIPFWMPIMRRCIWRHALGSAHTMSRAGQLTLLLLFKRAKTFSVVESAFQRYSELPNSKGKIDLVAQEFKRMTSLAFCNLIGPPWSEHADPKRYRQSPRPFLCVFILKELATRCGRSDLACETSWDHAQCPDPDYSGFSFQECPWRGSTVVCMLPIVKT